jgi:hypothetical protein
MPRIPNLQQEAVAAAGVEWRRHLHKRLDHAAPKQAERVEVGRRRWNDSAAPALQHAINAL